MEQHISRLALADLVLGIVHLCAAILLTVIMGGKNLGSGPEAGTFGQAMMGLVSLALGFTGLLSVAAGILLRRRTASGRMAGLTAAFFLLLVVPLGTILGSYGIWVLFQDESDALFHGRA